MPTSSTSGRRARIFLAVAALAATALALPAQARPNDNGCANRELDTVKQLLTCLNADDAFEHLAALQAIADANGGTRASGTPGYDASVDYVAGLLDAAGYDVERQEFDYPFFEVITDSLTIDGETPDFDTMTYSGSGEVTSGNVVPVDLSIADPAASTSGCEAADYDPALFTGDADIALVQRGACSFALKATNAEAAGAEAVLVFNQGTPGREDLFFGTLGGIGVTIPVMSLDFATGVELSTPGEDVSLSVEAVNEIRTTANVIAEMTGVNDDNVVMAGAHLDSVPEGPGIQDNGSGSTAILALALQLAESGKFTPQNTLRFAWWGAEEAGLVGSYEYFTNADFGLLNRPDADEQVARIAAYLNFDMIASPNYFFGVYDADESTFDAADFGVVVPEGSAAIEDLFEAYYTVNGVPYDDSAFSGRSDYQVFILLDIPSSGLFTGAEVEKTAEQQAIWGGTAGDQFDPCYHLACDTYDNVSMEAMEVNIDAVADAVFRLAWSTEAVNGVEGAELGGPAQTEIAGPEGTFAEGDGGLAALHGDDAE
jgi:Zn-dependent M28 family amino/carboxypeptidase